MSETPQRDDGGNLATGSGGGRLPAVFQASGSWLSGMSVGGSSLSGFADRAWESRGYHPWNAYCGRALAPGTIVSRAAVPLPPPTPRPGMLTRLEGPPHQAEAPVVTAFRRHLHEVHRLAEHLDRLRLDRPFVEVHHTLPPEMHHELADAIEVLVWVRDALPAGSAPRIPD